MVSQRLARLLIPALIPAAVLAAGPATAVVGAGGTRNVIHTGPPTATPADIRFERHTLRDGDPRQVGLRPEDIARMRTDAGSYLVPTADHPTFPTYAGAVVLAAKDGVIVQRAAVGTAVRYASVGGPPAREGVELPADQQIPTRPDTIFDLASISKLFTTIVAMQFVERGQINLDAPVARYLPEFAAGGKQNVTVRNLLTHTSGLPAFSALYANYPTPESRLAAAIAFPLAAGASPGNQYVYSDLGLISLGAMLERISGQRLDELVRTRITGPLRMTDTGYNPSPALKPRIAATEYEPYVNRGMVWGEVHDENSWALGGVAGHAGVFSTADDLAILCQLLLNGGEYRGQRILREDTIRSMLYNYNEHLETAYPESDRGLGFELDKHWYMGGISSPVTFGHTGFTGTTVTIDPLSHSFVILMSNRVHPDRNWGSNNVARRAMTNDFADAMPVRPLLPGTAWRADPADGTTATLTAALRAPARGASVNFLYWYDTEPRFDVARVETSADGGATWTPAATTLRGTDRRWTTDGTVTGYGGRQWWYANAALPDGTTHVRWTYSADVSSQGRGVYVDGVFVLGRNGLLLNSELGDADRFTARSWSPSDH